MGGRGFFHMSMLYDRAAGLVRTIYDRRLDGPPVLNWRRDFPGAADFVAAWSDIRDEAIHLATTLERVPRFHEIMPEQAEISANDARDWRMYILQAYGVTVPAHLAACPRLSAVVRGRPEVLSASISFLAPHKHIPPHRGPFRGVLRFYMVLSMPLRPDGVPAASLTIAGQEFRLRDGDFLLWDDTYTHEVLNDSDETRIVLLLDVWRPGMTADMQLLSRFLIMVVRAAIRWRGIR